MGMVGLFILGWYIILKLFDLNHSVHYAFADDSIEKETEDMYIMLKNVNDNFDLF